MLEVQAHDGLSAETRAAVAIAAQLLKDLSLDVILRRVENLC